MIYQTQSWGWLLSSSHGGPFYRFKNTCDVSVFLVTGDFPWLPWLFKYNREWVSNCISQFLQKFGMHLVSPMQLCMFRLLCFTSDGRYFIPTILAWRFRALRNVRKEITNKNWGKNYWVSQPSPCWLSLVLLSYLPKGSICSLILLFRPKYL